MRVDTVGTDELDAGRLSRLRALLDRAFDDFDDHDWAHALGGFHVVVELDGTPVAHASVVERPIRIHDREFRTGYVEAVATDPDVQGRGAGGLAMRRVGDLIGRHFELGALCTGLAGYYERFGWERWRGPTHVRGADGVRPTPEEDGLIFVLRHGPSATVDLGSAISCDQRTGDDW
jgi:aminoglycoside 2'-N-acetyltransferase I